MALSMILAKRFHSRFPVQPQLHIFKIFRLYLHVSGHRLVVFCIDSSNEDILRETSSGVRVIMLFSRREIFMRAAVRFSSLSICILLLFRNWSRSSFVSASKYISKQTFMALMGVFSWWDISVTRVLVLSCSSLNFAVSRRSFCSSRCNDSANCTSTASLSSSSSSANQNFPKCSLPALPTTSADAFSSFCRYRRERRPNTTAAAARTHTDAKNVMRGSSVTVAHLPGLIMRQEERMVFPSFEYLVS